MYCRYARPLKEQVAADVSLPSPLYPRLRLWHTLLPPPATDTHPALEREKAEVAESSATVSSLENRKRNLAGQLDALKADIEEWSARIRARKECGCIQIETVGLKVAHCCHRQRDRPWTKDKDPDLPHSDASAQSTHKNARLSRIKQRGIYRNSGSSRTS